MAVTQPHGTVDVQGRIWSFSLRREQHTKSSVLLLLIQYSMCCFDVDCGLSNGQVMYYVIVKERHETIMGYKPRERVALEWFIPIIVELLVL